MTADGVPESERTANDFMQVRAALVRRLGGANEALVWTRVDWRVDTKRPAFVDDEGVAWWPATREEIAEETGLTPEQARRAAAALVTAGFLKVKEHRLRGNYDRTKSYRTVVQSRPVERADSPNESGRIRPMDRAKSPNVPIHETYLDTTDRQRASSFDEFWGIWPKKVSRPSASKAWESAMARVESGVVVAAAIAYRDNPARPEHRFVPSPANWLREDGWNDDLPQRALSGAEQRQDANLRVLARYAQPTVPLAVEAGFVPDHELNRLAR